MKDFMGQDGFNISLCKWWGNAEYEITLATWVVWAEIGGLEGRARIYRGKPGYK